MCQPLGFSFDMDRASDWIPVSGSGGFSPNSVKLHWYKCLTTAYILCEQSRVRLHMRPVMSR